MSAFKRLSRFALLVVAGFLGSASPTANAQTLSSIRIGLNIEGPKFIVDGQFYNHTQNFVWPEGSTHIIQFPTADGSNIQYVDDRRARYTFNGWAAKDTSGVPSSFGSAIETIVASPKLTEVIGSIIKEFPVTITFQRPFDSGYCEEHITTDQPSLDLYGVMYFGPSCINKSTVTWVPEGIYPVRIYPYPGYAFAGWLEGNTVKEKPYDFSLYVNDRMEVGPVFEPAKRVRFTTFPQGLQLLVDRAPVTPRFLDFSLLPPQNGSDNCAEYHALPVGTPLNIPRLCVGDFDFKVGSLHSIGAPEVQTDRDAQYWVFDSFNNGMGQNSVLTAGSDTFKMDEIQARFVRGVRSLILSNVNGLKMFVDGRDNWPGPVYGFIWGEGHVHTISAPETQRDSKGRMWRFVRWSDGGEREHTVTVPLGADGFTVTGYFELLGQVQVTSTPPGLTLKVNGADCATPCTYDHAAGERITVEAPANLAFGEFSRYNFDQWIGGTKETTQEVTFTQDVQVMNARFFGSHQVVAYTDPDGGAKFKYSPESPDGFYAEGTRVQVTLTPNTGFKFIKWSEDLSSRSMIDSFVVSGPTTLLAHMEKVPAIAPAGIRNAAGDTPDGTVAPGSIISIYGEDLATELLIGPSNPLAQAIGNTYVTVDNGLLPLIFVSPRQINAQLLSTVGEGEHTLVIHNSGKPDLSAKFTVKRNAPGVFFNVTESGMPLVAALHEDGTPVTETSPARRGETITFFGTGLGAYDLPVIDGFILPTIYTYKLIDPVKVLAATPQPEPPAGSNAAEVPQPAPVVRDPAFAGGAAGMVGTSALKFLIDGDLPASNVLEITIQVNGSKSNKVQLPIQ